MRSPLRDIVPTRIRPVLTGSLACLGAAAVLWSPQTMPAALTLLGGLALFVLLGSTVEDQLGRPRSAALVAVAVLAALAITPTPSTIAAAMTACLLGAHLALFPSGRVLVWYRVGVLEVPTFFPLGCWSLALVTTQPGWPATVPAALLGLGLARVLRPHAHAQWPHFDHDS